MVIVRLLLSGLLVASGLILGAFTLHGYFDPHWAERQAQAAAVAGRADEPKSAASFRNRSRFVQARTEQAEPPPKPRPPASTAARPHPPAAKTAEAKRSAKAVRKSRQAEKAKKNPTPQQQQASFVWPWNLFNN